MNNRFIFLILFFFCTFSLSFLPVNPTYFILTAIILCIIADKIYTLQISKYQMILLIISLLFLIEQLYGLTINNQFSSSHEANNYLTPLLMFFSMLIGVIVPRYVPDERTLKTVLNVLFIYFTVELFSRFIQGGDFSSGFIYAFKKGPFYFDSNFLGIIILSIIFYCLYCRNIYRFNLNKQILILFVLLLFSFSRASILACIISFFIFNKHKNIKVKLFIFIPVSFMLFSYLVYLYFFKGDAFSNFDGSFNSKFNILYLYYEYVLYHLNESMILFGVGLGSSVKFIGIFAHNIVLTFILEMGIIGTFIFTSYIIYSIYLSKGNALYIWIPIFINGFSLFSAYMPMVFLINALICISELKNKKNII